MAPRNPPPVHLRFAPEAFSRAVGYDTGPDHIVRSTAGASAAGWRTLAEVFLLESEKVAFSDAVTLATVAGFLTSQGPTYRIAHESQIGLDRLRQGPSVLIRALNNGWGLRLAEHLRFTFSFDAGTLTGSVLDRGEAAWSIRLGAPFASVCEDRGVITRGRVGAPNAQVLVSDEGSARLRGIASGG